MNIPVDFEYEGKKYNGILTNVSGSGSSTTFYLMVNNRYCGSLVLAHWQTGPEIKSNVPLTWRFTTQTGKLDHLQHVFVKALNDAGIEGDEYIR